MANRIDILVRARSCLHPAVIRRAGSRARPRLGSYSFPAPVVCATAVAGSSRAVRPCGPESLDLAAPPQAHFSVAAAILASLELAHGNSVVPGQQGLGARGARRAGRVSRTRATSGRDGSSPSRPYCLAGGRPPPDVAGDVGAIARRCRGYRRRCRGYRPEMSGLSPGDVAAIARRCRGYRRRCRGYRREMSRLSPGDVAAISG